ncbi:hypothetical protein B0G75_104246 [Paraburkholderia sp. BL18I3N2]|nr:hypothetical protein B0G75_104246 [Paraburkholderia sp. BL18I3N2]
MFQSRATAGQDIEICASFDLPDFGTEAEAISCGKAWAVALIDRGVLDIVIDKPNLAQDERALKSNDDARAELLCYLVVAQLVAMARTGEWLRTDHLVESGRIWCKANGAHFDWQERIALGQIAAEMAPQVMETFGLTRERSLVPLFRDGWMLDYASPVVCGIHEVCRVRLERSA